MISTNFMYLRELLVLFLCKKTDLDCENVLNLKVKEVLFDHSSLFVNDNLISPMPDFFSAYTKQLEYLFPATEYLFPTTTGGKFRLDKYKCRLRKLFSLVGIQTHTLAINEITDSQYIQLIGQRFKMQRPWYQMVLASNLGGHLALRPSESAKLKKRDLDFGNKLITLRATKSGGEDQVLPILSFMIGPLQKYTAYLSDSDPLFINFSGNQWDRRDVTAAIKKWGKLHGFERMTSRCLRASLGAMLSRMKVPPALIAIILRHRDPATALRHYNYREIEKTRDLLNHLEQFDVEDEEYLKEYARLYRELEKDHE